MGLQTIYYFGNCVKAAFSITRVELCCCCHSQLDVVRRSEGRAPCCCRYSDEEKCPNWMKGCRTAAPRIDGYSLHTSVVAVGEGETTRQVYTAEALKTLQKVLTPLWRFLCLQKHLKFSVVELFVLVFRATASPSSHQFNFCNCDSTVWTRSSSALRFLLCLLKNDSEIWTTQWQELQLPNLSLLRLFLLLCVLEQTSSAGRQTDRTQLLFTNLSFLVSLSYSLTLGGLSLKTRRHWSM